MRRTPGIILLVNIFFFGVLFIMFLKIYSDPSDALKALNPIEDSIEHSGQFAAACGSRD